MKSSDTRIGARRSTRARRTALCLAAAAALVAVLFWPLLARKSGGKAAPSAQRSGERAAALPDEAVAATVLSSIAGDVRDQEGRAIAGASVCAVNVNTGAIGGSGSPCSTTDAQGAFALKGLPGGSYFVRASARGFWPAAANAGQPLGVRPPEARAGLHMVLAYGGAKVSGAVVDATGGAVPQATVRAARLPGPNDTAEILADEQGHFELYVSPGSIAVTAQAPGYTTEHVFAVAPSGAVVVVLTPAAKISGTVVTLDGRPAEGMRVFAMSADGVGPRSEPSAPTNELGEFTVSGLAPGSYDLTAEGNDRRGESQSAVEVDVAESRTGIVIVAAPAKTVTGRVVIKGTQDPCRAGNARLMQPEGSQVAVPTVQADIGEDGRVTFPSLLPGPYAVDVSCRDSVLVDGPRTLEVGMKPLDSVLWTVAPGLGLAVTVVDDGDRPAPHLTLQILRPRVPGAPPEASLATTDSAGRYDSPTVLEPGRYEISPRGNVEGDPVAVDLVEGMGRVPVKVRVKGSANLRVRVETRSGRPVENVTVVATSMDAPVPASPGAADGAAQPSVGAPPSEPSPADRMRSEVTRRTAMSHKGAPLGEGRYGIGPLVPGRYEVAVEDGVNPRVLAGGRRATAVTVTAADAGEVVVVLDRGGRIGGRVVDDAGGPLPNVWVTAVRDAGGADSLDVRIAAALGEKPGVGQRVLTDLDGRFNLDNLAPGTVFEVRAEEMRGGVAVKRGVRPGDDVVVAFAAAATLRGTATAADGELASATTVQLTQVETGWTRAVFVKPDGSFVFPGVSSGHLRLSAIDEGGRRASEDVELAPRQTRDVRLVLVGDRAPPDERPAL